MKKQQVFISHSSAIAALFILGNSVIALPSKLADKYTFLAYLIAAPLSFLLYIILIPLINKVYNPKHKKISPLKKGLILSVYFLTAVAAIWYSAEAFIEFSNFASELLLQDYPKTVVYLLFGGTVIIFALCRQENFLKFGLIFFVLTAIAILFFFLFSISNFKFNNIVIFDLPKANEFITQFKQYLLNPLLSTLLIAVYEVCLFNKVRLKATFWGLGLGFTLLGICILNSVLIFTPEFAALLDYPYASAVSTVTIGRLFTRLDGFSYFIYYSAVLTRITVCLFLVKSLLQKSDTLFNHISEAKEL